MSTRRETAEYLLEQLEPLDVRVHPMFGCYGLYCDEKIVAFLAGETVFLKPTLASDGHGFTEAELYPGSKLYRLLTPELLEDSERLRVLVQATAEALPAPKPKRPRTSGPRR